MPVYLHIVNLVIDKKAIREKYAGGIEQFRIDYEIPLSEINQEDDELFSLGQMNSDEFDIDRLISKGLSFDVDKQHSEDFTIVYRYGEFFWDVEWLKHNRVFAWHIDIPPELLSRMEEVSNMPMQDVFKEAENGNQLLKAIRKEHIWFWAFFEKHKARIANCDLVKVAVQ